MNRRRFVQSAGAAGFTLMTAGCTLPFSTPPPPAAKAHRIARIASVLPNPATDAMTSAFRGGLRDLGYVEGENLIIEERYTDGDDKLAEPVAELVALGTEVILVNGIFDILVVRAASATMPIVSGGSGDTDLVGAGLAASYARPGGSITGLSVPRLEGRQLQLFREAVPALSHVVVLFGATTNFAREPYEAAAQPLDLQLQFLGVGGPEDLEALFESVVREQADGLFVLNNRLITLNQTRICELALQSSLPSMWQQTDAVARGGLMGYGANRADLYRRAAGYVDKILKGAKPADLPIEQPDTFDFIINLKTAEAIGLTIPPALLVQATEIIR